MAHSLLSLAEYRDNHGTYLPLLSRSQFNNRASREKRFVPFLAVLVRHCPYVEGSINLHPLH